MSCADNPITKHIAVMGATGTGKSTFINLITRDEKIVVGHGTESKTDSIIVSCYSPPGDRYSITLVDTPGFDDSRDGHSDVDILRRITDFLMDGGGKKLNGIIYMHRISDPRTGGTAKKNLRMFKELCGEKILDNVLIVTTNWSRVTEEEGAHREQDLKGGFFKTLIGKGARMVRHDNSVESAVMIISLLQEKCGVAPKIVDELRNRKNLEDTSAGAVLNADIKAIEVKHKKEMQELKVRMDNAALAGDVDLHRERMVEYEELTSKLDQLRREREKLKHRDDLRHEASSLGGSDVEGQRLELQIENSRKLVRHQQVYRLLANFLATVRDFF